MQDSMQRELNKHKINNIMFELHHQWPKVIPTYNIAFLANNLRPSVSILCFYKYASLW